MKNIFINNGFVITIDGPSGCGKGTISQMLADKLGWHFLDSGAIYRLLALAVIKHQLQDEEITRITSLAEDLDIEFKTNSQDKTIHCFLDKKDVSDEIRSEACANMASKISKVPEVRQALLKRQRDFQQPPGLIADGRDMGTVVFPDAKLKIFLEACSHERAKRRYNQLIEKRINVSLAQILVDLEERDARDRQRAISPLKPAEDAVILDTTYLSIQEVFHWVMEKVKAKGLWCKVIC